MAASISRSESLESEDLPLESCTRTPAFIGWMCDICFNQILVPDKKIVHATQIHCIPCYNKVLVQAGVPEITKRQFQRLSRLQYKAVITGLSDETLKQTKRAAQFKRKPEDVEEAMKNSVRHSYGRPWLELITSPSSSMASPGRTSAGTRSESTSNC